MPRRLLPDKLVVVFKKCPSSRPVIRVAPVAFVRRLRMLGIRDGELVECEDQMTLA